MTYVTRVLQMLEASSNASRFTVTNIFTVAFYSKWNHVSRSRVAVNGIIILSMIDKV